MAEREYWIIDHLPVQVPAEDPANYFAVDEYLYRKRKELLYPAFASFLLRLNCYYHFHIEDETDPAIETLVSSIGEKDLSIRIGNEGKIELFQGDLYMVLYEPSEKLLAMCRTLAAAAGLFIHNP